MFDKSVLRVMAGGVLAATIVGAATTHASQPTTTAGSLAGWVAKASKLGAAPNELSVTIAVHLALKDVAGLKNFVAEVSSPSSQQYGRYLSAQDFAARFAPAAGDVSAVEAMLEHAGMSNVKVGPYGVYVSATATVSQLRSAFRVSQSLYRYKGQTLRANAEEPTLPASLAGKVIYVEGLDDSGMFRHPYRKTVTQGALVAPAVAGSVDASPNVTPPPVAAGNPAPYCNTYYGAAALTATLSTAADVYGASIPWLNCGYTPQQIQAAYGLNKVKYDGSGVTIAIVDAYASPTIVADGNHYAKNHSLPPLTTSNFSQIVPLGIYSVSPSEPCGPYGWWGEESLDVSAAHGAAPGAKIVFVGSRDCGTSLDTAFFNTVYNHVADVVTSSWGDNGEAVAPGTVTSYDQAAMAGAAQGMTVLFSSGDDGDLAAINGVASGAWPSTSAYVTGVGGTSLFIRDPGGDKSEYGWGNYRDYLGDATVNSASSVTTSGLETTTANGQTFDAFAFYAGSGGGISLLEPQPTYQAQAVPVALATTLNLANGYATPLPTAQRVSPDVAMVGDPYTGYLSGESFTIAGNSIADAGCTPTSKTQEYCEVGTGGTSLASPLMAGVMAVMDQKRKAGGEPLVGFANPLLYAHGSGTGVGFDTFGLNEISAPKLPVSVLRGYASNLTEVRVVTINSVPLLIDTTPYVIQPCAKKVCLGIDDVFNFTSNATSPATPPGYNDVTGLGVPYVPLLIAEQ